MNKKEILFTGLALAMGGMLSSCDGLFGQSVNVYGPPPNYNESEVFESSYWSDEEESSEPETEPDKGIEEVN